MAEIVNLNRARKAKRRAEAAASVEASRARHGATRAERAATATEKARRDALLDGARREE